MKIERDQYRKNLELEYKEFSEQQMSRYMAEIQSLYSIVRGFRHDLGNLVISMSLAIEEENIPEIQRIHREVLEKVIKRSIQKHYQDSTWSISKILLYEVF